MVNLNFLYGKELKKKFTRRNISRNEGQLRQVRKVLSDGKLILMVRG